MKQIFHSLGRSYQIVASSSKQLLIVLDKEHSTCAQAMMLPLHNAYKAFQLSKARSG